MNTFRLSIVEVRAEDVRSAGPPDDVVLRSYSAASTTTPAMQRHRAELSDRVGRGPLGDYSVCRRGDSIVVTLVTLCQTGSIYK